MSAHFSVINKRGVITASIIMAFAIVIFSLGLSQQLAGGGIIWCLPLICGAIFFLLALIILVLVVTAGVDVQNGTVVFADATGQGGKQPRFKLSELEDIQLHNMNGQIDPDTDSLVGGRIVFFTTSGEQFVYYPVQITARQYKNVRKGLFNLKSKI